MKAEWKKPLLELIKRKAPARDAAQRIAELEEHVKLLRQECAALNQNKEFMFAVERRLQAQVAAAENKASMFDYLSSKEVMVPDKDGFKLLTGSELEEYCCISWKNTLVATREKIIQETVKAALARAQATEFAALQLHAQRAARAADVQKQAYAYMLARLTDQQIQQIQQILKEKS